MSILDFMPALLEGKEFEGCGAEPSLRSLVFKYYAAHFPEPEAVKYAGEYCAQIERKEVGA